MSNKNNVSNTVNVNKVPPYIYPARPMTVEDIMEWVSEGLTSEETYYIDEMAVPRILANVAEKVSPIRNEPIKDDMPTVAA